MPSYKGSNLLIQWIHSGGTLSMNPDFREVSYAPSVDLFEDTAGADQAKGYVAGQKDGKIDFKGVDQSKQMIPATWGTALLEGNGGTLIISPEGTAAGNAKFTIPAISLGANLKWPYNNICEISVSFQQNGVRTDAVY
jgi:hypothetical protein